MALRPVAASRQALVVLFGLAGALVRSLAHVSGASETSTVEEPKAGGAVQRKGVPGKGHAELEAMFKDEALIRFVIDQGSNETP